MGWRRGNKALAELCIALALTGGGLSALGAGGQVRTVAPAAVQTTQITDTIFRADGTGAAGTVLVSWPAFTTASGANVPAGSKSVVLGAGGALSLALVANAGSTPIGSYYTVVYHLDDGLPAREYWVVPATIATVKVAAIRSTVLPTSVAMQTVSKSYVDTAIAAAVTGHPLDSSPYVVKAGDQMTGPLLLAADPTSPTEASDKRYVDAQVAAVAAGGAQKVSTNPQATQVVTQPAGTELDVNDLNGREYASQYQTGTGNNGIANATAGPDCTAGCDVVAEQTYGEGSNLPEQALPTTWNNRTQVEDRRGGAVHTTFNNPTNVVGAGDNSATRVTLESSEAAQAVHAATGAGNVLNTGLVIDVNALAGGSNVFPALVQGTVPYFKSTYTALRMTGQNNTLGQHVLNGMNQNCYGVGDCLMGGMFMLSSGGFRDDADEGAHPFDLQFKEDLSVFRGNCATGCTTGSQLLQVTTTGGGGSQGEGRYLIDTNPAKTITQGTLIGGATTGLRHPQAIFSGSNFPVSTFLETAQTVPTQVDNIEPGTVNVAIVTSGVPAGFAGNTAALPATTGVACVSDVNEGDGRPTNFEIAAYTVVDGSHLRMTLVRPHANGATVAAGGLCGYGLEQTVDTVLGLRQLFPVIGSQTATTLLYAGNQTPLVGMQAGQSAYANVVLVPTSVSRTNGVVTVNVASGMPVDLNGLAVTVQGVTDPSYNGVFTVATPSKYALTYAQAGPDSTSTGGTVSYVTGGFALYPMAEVLGVFNQTTHAIDGQLKLGANAVAWAAGDPVEQPHYFQQAVSADTEQIVQYLPRPGRLQSAGISYQGNVGPGLRGWLIGNDVLPSQYYGNGGTHSAPNAGMEVDGVWQQSLNVEAGEDAAVKVRCNSHGCDRWDSAYDLFQMDTSAGVDRMHYQPQTSTLTFTLRGTPYTFNPLGFTAGTINATTINATTLHGTLQGAVSPGSLPLFGASGAAHAQGAVPDPGANPGTTRYLREDGVWATVSGASSGSGGTTTTVATTSGPQNLPGRADLAGEYLMNEGSGTVAHDTSGQGNDATLGGVNGGPAWESTTDLNFNRTGEYVQLPAAVNAARTWQIAFYNPPYGSGAQPQAPGYGDASSFGANPALLCGTDTGHLCLTGGAAGTSLTFKASTDGTRAAEAMPVGWHVFTMICGTNVNNVVTPTRYLYDGNEVGSYASVGNGTTCPTPTAGSYQIGGAQVSGTGAPAGTWFVGKVAAAWAWNRALTLGEGSQAAKSALSYIATKGVPGQYRALPSEQPAVIAGLDERSAAGTWTAGMTLTDPSYQVVSLGGKGTVYDACVQFDLTYGQQIAARRGNAIVVLWGGQSDLLDAGQTPRQIANSLRCLVRKSKAAGARVIVATETSSSNGGSTSAGTVDGDAGKNALNTIVRSEAKMWGADNVADIATETHMGYDGAYQNQGCISDGRHLQPACQAFVTTILQNAINELLGTTEATPTRVSSTSYTETASDRFLMLTGTAEQTVKLPDCTGLSLAREISNPAGQNSFVATQNGQMYAGSTLIPAYGHGRILPVPGTPSTAGCSWVRTD